MNMPKETEWIRLYYGVRLSTWVKCKVAIFTCLTSGDHEIGVCGNSVSLCAGV